MSDYIKREDAIFVALQQPLYSVVSQIKQLDSIDLDTDVWCEDCKEYDKEHHNCPRFNRVIRTALEDADMVRVVRCKECKFSKVYQNDSSGVMGRFCEAFTQVRMVSDDDFCSYGERREP